MQYQDYYKTLGVERNADEGTIKKAYRKLAMQYHPDRNPGDQKAEERFKQVNEAYQVLSDPAKRARYDQLGQSYSQWQQRGGSTGGFDWSQWYANPGGGQRVNVNLDDLFGQGGGGFSEFFSRIFGGMAGGAANSTPDFGFGQRTGRASRRTTVTITLAEAFAGTTRRIEADGKRLEVKIPPGARTGTKVRAPGALTSNEGQKRDLILDIEVSPDARFERDGNNLIVHVAVDLYTAVLGGSAKVPTLTGDVMLTIPPGTQPEQTFRLAGQGMPHLRQPQTRGDLLVRVSVRIPRKLTPEQKKLFEDLSKM
ncbi:MAG: DnaJ C-terminal domain-containing protein [Chloroflexota bacterium]